MANNFYCRTSLIGGGGGALDQIDGAGLNDLDFAAVSVLNKVYFYTLDDDSGAAELSPNIISPDANAGTKRWLLQGINLIQKNDVTSPALSFGDENTGFMEISDNVLNLIISGGQSAKFQSGWCILGINTGSGGLANVVASATVPSFVPDSGDNDTGIGQAGDDQLSLIAGGVEGIRVSNDSGIINVDITGNLNLVSFENATVYFEGSAVFN